VIRYEITTTARRDLADIDDYTADRRGDAKAAQYIARLFGRFERLAGDPELGRRHPDGP